MVRVAGNFASLLSYLSAYPMAYYLAPALTLLVKSEERVQQICPFSDTASHTKSIILKWGYTLMITLGFCLCFFSTFSNLGSNDLLISILMNWFKIYSSVLAIQTFDTVYRSTSMHFLILTKQFDKLERKKDKFEFLTCLKEQFDLIQKGFGSYLLSQFSFLTFSFILLSYDFMIRLMLYSSYGYSTKFCMDQAGIMIVMLTNLFKMVMIAYSAYWMKTAVEDIRFKLMEERETCQDENELKVNLK